VDKPKYCFEHIEIGLFFFQDFSIAAEFKCHSYIDLWNELRKHNYSQVKLHLNTSVNTYSFFSHKRKSVIFAYRIPMISIVFIYLFHHGYQQIKIKLNNY